MLTAETTDQILQRYPMLGDLPPAQLEDLRQNAASMQVPAGTTMFDEDQTCQGFPLLISGSVRVIKAASSGRELQLYRVEPGDSCIITSSCLLGQSRYPARGVTETATELVVLPAPLFRRLIAANEAFRDHVFVMFSDRISELMQLVSAVAFQRLDQRLAALLLSKPPVMRTTHQALADELGSVREMVSRLLKNFAEQGWVRLGREQVEVLDTAALQRYLND